MPGKRHKGRTIALQALFELDSVGHSPAAAVEHIAEGLDAPDEVRSFAVELVEGVASNKAKIDEVIERTAPAFPLDQIATVDRNILRLAIYEILLDNKVPMRAAINEAVELAKEYGGENSPRFINGVLGSVSTLSAPASQGGN
jgi:N utilization substance protein B